MSKRAGSVWRLAMPLRAWASRFTFVLVVAATFAAMVIGRTDPLLIERARATLVDAVTPLVDIASRPVASLDAFLAEARGFAELRQINGELQAENDRLLAWHRRALQLETENAALRQLLNLVPEAGRRYVTARVISDQGGSYVRSLLVLAGRQDGIVKGQAALSGEGLVGRAVEVGERATRVLLVTDINSRIPVHVGLARDKAVLAGDNTAEPVLLYLAPGSSAKVGDPVLTSGHGGVFPPGLPIGVVSGASEKGLRVSPYVDWAHLDYVRLVDYELEGLISALAKRNDGAGR